MQCHWERSVNHSNPSSNRHPENKKRSESNSAEKESEKKEGAHEQGTNFPEGSVQYIFFTVSNFLYQLLIHVIAAVE